MANPEATKGTEHFTGGKICFVGAWILIPIGWALWFFANEPLVLSFGILFRIWSPSNVGTSEAVKKGRMVFFIVLFLATALFFAVTQYFEEKYWGRITSGLFAPFIIWWLIHDCRQMMRHKRIGSELTGTED